MNKKKVPEWFLIPYEYIKIYTYQNYQTEDEKLPFKQVLWEINEYIHELKEADIPIQNKILTWA